MTEREIQGWTVHEEIGRGGMGVLYRATNHVFPDRAFALKAIRPDLVGDASLRRRFLREAAHAHALHHPNIVRCELAFEATGQLYLPMELLRGRALSKALLAQEGPWRWPRAVEVARQAAAGLGHAHASGVLHRDVKPGNLFLAETEGGEAVKLLDFGLVKGLGEQSLTGRDSFVGTPAYVAPEILDGERATPATDVYALGVVLYRMLTGALPLTLPGEQSTPMAMMMAVARAHQQGLPRVSGTVEVPAWLDELVARMLARSPGQRPADGDAAARALSEGAAEVPPEDVPTGFGLPTFGAASAVEAAAREPAVTPEADDDGTGFGLPRMAPPAPPPPASQPKRPEDPGLAERDDAVAHGGRRWRWVAASGVLVVIGAVTVSTFAFRRDGTPSVATTNDESSAATSGESKRDRGVADSSAAPEPFPVARARADAATAPVEAAPAAAPIEWITLPAGTFKMGSTKGDPNEKPVRQVSVSGFALSKTEVTVGQYRACVEAGACTAPDTEGSCNWSQSGRDEHPINCVDWEQASAFAKWAGGRLPSEAEWEYAARSGGKDQTYGWGNAKADCGRAVMDDGSGNGCGKGNTTWPVCSKPAGNTAQGLCDMAGNVWEWVEDWYGPYGEAPSDGSARTQAAQGRVGRGGCWFNFASLLRAAFRDWGDPGLRGDRLGFRVARSAP